MYFRTAFLTKPRDDKIIYSVKQNQFNYKSVEQKVFYLARV